VVGWIWLAGGVALSVYNASPAGLYMDKDKVREQALGLQRKFTLGE
jgi:hypothetical protein